MYIFWQMVVVEVVVVLLVAEEEVEVELSSEEGWTILLLMLGHVVEGNFHHFRE